MFIPFEHFLTIIVVMEHKTLKGPGFNLYLSSCNLSCSFPLFIVFQHALLWTPEVSCCTIIIRSVTSNLTVHCICICKWWEEKAINCQQLHSYCVTFQAQKSQCFLNILLAICQKFKHFYFKTGQTCLFWHWLIKRHTV